MLPGSREDRNIDADVKETFHRSGRHCLVTCPVGLLRRSLLRSRRGPLRSGRAIFIRKKILVCGKGHGSADRLEWAGQGLVEKEPRVNLVGEQAFFLPHSDMFALVYCFLICWNEFEFEGV